MISHDLPGDQVSRGQPVALVSHDASHDEVSGGDDDAAAARTRGGARSGGAADEAREAALDAPPRADLAKVRSPSVAFHGLPLAFHGLPLTFHWSSTGLPWPRKDTPPRGFHNHPSQQPYSKPYSTAAPPHSPIPQPPLPPVTSAVVSARMQVLERRHSQTDAGRLAAGGDPKFAGRVAKRAARGQRTARQNVEALVDEGTFYE